MSIKDQDAGPRETKGSAMGCIDWERASKELIESSLTKEQVDQSRYVFQAGLYMLLAAEKAHVHSPRTQSKTGSTALRASYERTLITFGLSGLTSSQQLEVTAQEH